MMLCPKTKTLLHPAAAASVLDSKSSSGRHHLWLGPTQAHSKAVLLQTTQGTRARVGVQKHLFDLGCDKKQLSKLELAIMLHYMCILTCAFFALVRFVRVKDLKHMYIHVCQFAKGKKKYICIACFHVHTYSACTCTFQNGIVHSCRDLNARGFCPCTGSHVFQYVSRGARRIISSSNKQL